MFGFIYETTNIINNKKYIGKRVYDKRGQWKTYLGSGTFIKKAIKKYGKDNFKRRILCECETEEELNEKEKYYIRIFNAVEDRNYYNSAEGGAGAAGVKKSKATLELMAKGISEAFTDERKKDYSKRMKENNPNKDGRFSKGRHLTPEQRAEMSKIRIGKPGLKGQKNGMYGKCGELSPVYGEKNSFARKVRCIETDEVFTTIKNASEKFNISASQISACCRSVNKTAGGLHWEYADDKNTRIVSEQARRKISEQKKKNNPISKPVICKNTGEIFSSAYAAGRKYNVTGEAISAACKKINKVCCNMVWEYATDAEINEYKQKNSA